MKSGDKHKHENKSVVLINDSESSSLIKASDLSYKKSFIEVMKSSGSTALIAGLFAVTNFVMAKSFSELGPNELAASGLITAGQIFIYNSFSGASRPFGIVISNLIKNHELEKISSYNFSGLLYSTFLGVVAMSTAFAFPGFLELICQPEDIVSITKSFFYPYAIGLIPKFLLTTLRDLSFSTKVNFPPFISAMIEQGLIAGLGYCFTTGAFGFPQDGVSGFAYVSCIVSTLSLIAYVIYLLLEKKDYKLISLPTVTELIEHLKTLASAGVPAGFSIASERAAVAFTAIMTGWKGSDALTAQEIAMQYMMLEIIPFYGVSRGLGILVARHSNNLSNIKRLNIVAVSIATFVSSIFLINYSIFSKYLVNLFLSGSNSMNQDVENLASNLIITNSVAEVFDCNRSVMEGCLKGIGQIEFTIKTNLISTWGIGIVLSLVLGFVTKFDTLGIFIGRAIGVFVGTIALALGWLFKSKSNNPNVNSKVSSCPKSTLFKPYVSERIEQPEEIEKKESKLCKLL